MVCRWCGVPLPARSGPGRRRQFCDRRCRYRLFGRLRWIGVERERRQVELAGWEQILAAGPWRPGPARTVKGLRSDLAALDAEAAALRGEPSREGAQARSG